MVMFIGFLSLAHSLLSCIAQASMPADLPSQHNRATRAMQTTRIFSGLHPPKSQRCYLRDGLAGSGGSAKIK
jgi:hypothetical protein